MAGSGGDTVLVLGRQEDFTDMLWVIGMNSSIPGQGKFSETKGNGGQIHKSSSGPNGCIKAQ